MNTPPPQSAKRRSLTDLVGAQVPEAPRVQDTSSARADVPAGARQTARTARAKYPSVTVYLPRRAVRLIKELALEEERRISDILADAVNEYLQKRGHPSIEQLSE
jgi:hypothetical protein